MANKYVNKWVLILCTSKSDGITLIKPTQELSDYAWNMQEPARAARPSYYFCLPRQASRCLSSSPATYYSSADEDPIEEDEEKRVRQLQIGRSHSCSKLQAKLVPSFKSLLRRAQSHGSLHDNRQSQSCCNLDDFAAEGSRRKSKKKCKRAPKGHVAVYVEAGRERQVVPIDYLSHPHFRALLERAETEFGLCQKGPGLRIPCSLSELHHTLHQIRTQ